jgi:hypothetical protein
MGEMRNARDILIGKPKGRRPFGRLRRRWEDKLDWILGKYGGKVWNGFIWLRIRTSSGLL